MSFSEKRARKMSIVEIPNILEMNSSVLMDKHDYKKMKIYEWYLEPQFYLIGGLNAATKIFITISQSYITFYVQYYLRLPKEYIVIAPIVIIIAGLPTSAATKYLTKKVGLNVTFVISCIIGLGKFLKLNKINLSALYIKIDI